MSRLASTSTLLLGLPGLSACGYQLHCEQPPWDRVVTSTITLGLHEVGRVLNCPSEEEIADLKEKAKSGDPEAQYKLGWYYLHSVSPWSERHESAERAGSDLMRCAAEGGSPFAQGYSWLDKYLEEPEASKITYKFHRITAERLECDCDGFNNIFGHSYENCFSMCRSVDNAAENLDPLQIEQLENEIAAYEPNPTICEVELMGD